MKTDIITATSFPIDEPTAQIISHAGFPSQIHAIVSGKKLGMDISINVTLELNDYEVLEIVDYWDGDGYIEYYCDLFKDYKFVAEACFEREGQDFIPLEITNPQLEIETAQ